MKVKTLVFTDKSILTAKINADEKRYSFSNPYNRGIDKVADSTAMTAQITGFIEGKEVTNEVTKENTIPIYALTNKNTRCRVSIDQYNALEIGTGVNLIKSSGIIGGTLRHWYSLDSIVSNPEVVNATADTKVEATTN